VDYAINDRMAVGITYKFLGTTKQEFDDNYAGSIEMDATYNHMVALTFKVRF
jgi:hypothetical protein